MMTQKRFRTLAECYGADLSRWSAADRGLAETLLAQSPEARAVLREQQEVDAVIARAFDAQDAELHARSAHEDTHAALTRLRAGVAGRIAEQSGKMSPSRGWRRFIFHRPLAQPAWAMTADGLVIVRRAGLVLGCAFAVTGGLWLGWVQSSGGAGDLFNSLLVIPVSGGGS
ncbi:hypothetical protein AA0242T_2958 [Acetobacter aceti NRIC 0242]|mgnify:CR=1 FL=1|jgi:hypothetical protein|uniref:Uncharacterized protein n=2 Tax=Acetobacter aceti TaxID=435 RepID=A0A6S6PEU6_ACEAC|nr:hypothetical protein [Acetobacter aceti]GBO82256.1 hypothetical protein AA0242T_2958 [Acetobacter aceti NRIC 0242]TCS31107.1 hypothetical protein EDC15_11735 [Acetobacter aceti NBRC 14818]BCI65783.1 hypothetical protein AAJCM20276_04070 [Acetobacter aceti]BCK76682.1 hypothetical protein EMQ_2288 [Acetobacter aceti NBRC 14818]GAN58158.1 hypothetical protein Abac_034_034 [Acetobacter aceti NBRC 14818]